MKKLSVIVCMVISVAVTSCAKGTAPTTTNTTSLPINSTSAWSAMNSGTTNNFSGVWGSSATNVYAIVNLALNGGGNSTIIHYDGNIWNSVGGGTFAFEGIWGSSASDIFAVGEDSTATTIWGIILHYNGSTWTSIWNPASVTGPLTAVWGSSANNVFAVGYGLPSSLILHYDGNAWSPMNVNSTTPWLYGVWGSSSANVFAVGYQGAILHYDGSAWSTMNSGTTADLHGVWGTSATNIYAVGSSGTILHYDGSTWSAIFSDRNYIFESVWGSSANNIFAVGMGTGFPVGSFTGLTNRSTLFHYNGNTWVAMDSGTPSNLYCVWGSSATDVFAVGDTGTILHYSG